MATQMKVPAIASGTHHYHANASVLSAEFEQPIREKIESRAVVHLPEEGGYEYERAEPYRLKGILSYESGYAQVAGHRNSKAVGFTTLASAAIEGLNILDVVTADRIVGQIATEHPDYRDNQDPVPRVTFLGTRFDNLRIGGHKVEVERHLDILGPKPAKRRSYLEDSGVLGNISTQYAAIKKAKGLPLWASERYRWDLKAAQAGPLCCSLVRSVKGFPGTCFGHVIEVPHFGKIFLGELKVERKKPARSGDPETYTFHLTMIRLELGCIAHGSGNIVPLDSNGSGGKP
jgi:hypothetical protein